MKKFMLWCFVVSVFVGYVNYNNKAEAEEPIFSSSTLTIRSGKTGLVVEIRLPDGSIEKVTPPPPGILPIYPQKDPVAEQKYQKAFEELESFLKTYPNIKRSQCDLYLKVGRNQDAKACYEQVADIFRNSNNIAAQALAINQAALFQWEFDQKEAAIQQAWSSFEIYRQHIRNLRQAKETYQNALADAEEIDDQERQLLVQHQLALIEYALGDTEKSKLAAEEALRLFEKIEYPLMGKQRMKELIVNQIWELLEELRTIEKEEK